jgi:hypothetical protein
MRHHRDDTGEAAGGRIVDLLDASACDRTGHDDRVEHILDGDIDRVLGLAAHLQGSFDAVERRADERLAHSAIAFSSARTSVRRPSAIL